MHHILTHSDLYGLTESAVRRSVPAVDNAPSNGVAVEVKEQPVRESPAIAKKIPRNGTTIHRNSDESNRKTAVRESPWKVGRLEVRSHSL